MFARRAMMGGLALALAGALSSCGGGGSSGGSGGGDAGFDVELIMLETNGTPRSSFGFGTNIVWTLKVTNRSGGSQTLNLPTAQIFDLAVYPDGSTTPRWRWSFNRTFAPQATNLVFGSHQAITYPFIWNGVLDDGTQIMPGTYEFRATLAYANYDILSDDELTASPRRITITN